jgi:hypothetical protein
VRSAGDNAVGLFYYSGHGAAAQDTGVNYLIPVDVKSGEDSDLWASSLKQSYVIDTIKQGAPNATHFFVFDACRNELKVTKKGSQKSLDDKGFKPITESKGMLIAYATAPGETASDVGNKAGPYARAFAAELARRNVEAVALFRRVQIRVKEEIGQDPWLSFPALPVIYFDGAMKAASADPDSDQSGGGGPKLSEACKKELAKWQAAPAVGVFATSRSGVCGASSGHISIDVARTEAMAACAKQAPDCRVLEVNEGDWALTAACSKLLSDWRGERAVKAFAVARNGRCAYAHADKSVEVAKSKAIESCETVGRECKIAHVDAGDWSLTQTCSNALADFRTKEAVRAFYAARNGRCFRVWNYESIAEARKDAAAGCALEGPECKMLEEFEGNWEVGGDCINLLAQWKAQSRRYGAFAVSKTGSNCGWSTRYSSQNTAEDEALLECQKRGQNCKVVEQK